MLKRIYIYGVGAGYEIVKTCLLPEKVQILAYIDANASKFPTGINGIPVITVEQLDMTKSFDFIVLAMMKFENVDENLKSKGVSKEKIIRFFYLQDSGEKMFWTVIDRNAWKMEVLSYLYTNEMRPFMANMKYELVDEINKYEIKLPQIMSIKETVQTICENKKSICRFGDGEFELMQLRKRAKFQETDEKLAERLKEVIKAKDEKILLAIADNYGALKQYTKNAQTDIRIYLTEKKRKEHYSFLNMDVKYGNAYFTRPYIIYRDKENAKDRFEQIKQIWKEQDILVVEGDKTRLGVGNDLLGDASTVQRILAPSENAFSKYDDILKAVKKYGKDKLILIALGPTATVLAYDLAKEGYWAIDIGHIDIEYEWYKRQVQDRCVIPYKYVNEIAHGECVVDDKEFAKYQEKYEREIVGKIM